jgi:hypothetical protein
VPELARWAISSPVPRLVETHRYATAVPSLSMPSAAAVIAYDGGLNEPRALKQPQLTIAD